MKIENIEPASGAMDKSFRYTGDQWSKDFHASLELPGRFKKLLQNDTLKDPKIGTRMDLLELVELDGGNEILKELCRILTRSIGIRAKLKEI